MLRRSGIGQLRLGSREMLDMLRSNKSPSRAPLSESQERNDWILPHYVWVEKRYYPAC
jgi:hypothetical protein